MAGLSGPMQERLARVLANLLLLLLVVWLAGMLASLTWELAWPERAVPPPVAAAGSSGPEVAASYPLAGYTLFGQPKAAAGVTEAARRAAPETRLRLRLEGVLIGPRPEVSGAIVAGSNGETAYYRVGDQLPGNAQLAEVEPDRILIRRGGRYESLMFEEPRDSGVVAQAQEKPAESGPDAFLAAAQEQLDTMGVAALSRYGLRPAGEPGQTAGYVYDGSNAMLNAASLRAGDVIVAINGQRLGDFEQDRYLLESWRSQPQLEIEIERDGSILTVSYAIPEQWR